MLKDLYRFNVDIPSTDIISYLYNLEKFIYTFTGKGYNFTKSFADNMTYITFTPLNKYQNLMMRPNQCDTSYKNLLKNLDTLLEKKINNTLNVL